MRSREPWSETDRPASAATGQADAPLRRDRVRRGAHPAVRCHRPGAHAGPASVCRVSVLPTPLGPSTPTVSPVRIDRPRPSTSTRSPTATRSALHSSAGFTPGWMGRASASARILRAKRTPRGKRGIRVIVVVACSFLIKRRGCAGLLLLFRFFYLLSFFFLFPASSGFDVCVQMSSATATKEPFFVRIKNIASPVP